MSQRGYVGGKFWGVDVTEGSLLTPQDTIPVPTKRELEDKTLDKVLQVLDGKLPFRESIDFKRPATWDLDLDMAEYKTEPNGNFWLRTKGVKS